MLQKQEIRDTDGRRLLNKRIHKQVKRELRIWKAKWTDYLIEKFENTK